MISGALTDSAGQQRVNENRAARCVVRHLPLPRHQAAQHRNAFIVRGDLERPHPLCIFEGLGTSLLAQHPHVSVPIAPLDSDIRDQVVQISFVYNNDAGMFQGRFIAEIVIGVVADLVEDDIESRGIELSRLRRKHLYVRQLAQLIEQCGGVIGDSAAGRRQRREKSDLSCHESVCGAGWHSSATVLLNPL